MMRIAIVYQPPGQDVPRLGRFFGSYYINKIARVEVWGNMLDHFAEYLSSRPGRRLVQVRDLLFNHSLRVGPVAFAFLLPNYHFPPTWYEEAGAQQKCGPLRRWPRVSCWARKTASLVALVMFTYDYALVLYSYLGHPFVDRRAWMVV